MRLLFIFLLVSSSYILQAQDAEKKPEKVFQTFKDTRVINTHSTEMLPAGNLDFRVGHRFGDFLGDGGGWQTFYGLEEASDIMIGFEYGLSKNIMIGINRAKGSGQITRIGPNGNDLPATSALRKNVNGILKIRIAEQEVNGNLPFSLAVLAVITGSTMEKSERESDINFFEKTSHRFAYHAEFLIARKFSNYFSLQASGAWTYRNIVAFDDKNDLASFSLSARLQMTKSMGIILDGRYVFSDIRTTENGYYPPLGIGLEWDTGGGHVFQLNFTNATGIEQTDYIPYTQSNWGDGEFRLGFTIARQFRL